MLGPLIISLVLRGAAPTPEAPRVAVIVGSNVAVAGRTVLRFAKNDAQEFASVLVSNGGFQRGDVEVLIDSKPGEVLAGLQRARAKLHAFGNKGVLIFYYSGHADERALYPGGEALPLESLKSELADEQVGVRIGIIDACRGGGWTQAKGLSPTAPFAVGLSGLSSEGTALLASSSGLEDAHETDALQGSFFTHYLVAGLRGAADSSGDGQVTLSEAFAYANHFTVRDTATRSAIAQHPSFDLRLRGRQDVVLTSLAQDSTQLLLAQRVGPLEVVQLSTGVTVVEGVPGEQVLRLALPPGPYLIRRVRGSEVLSHEVQVVEGEATRLDESALTLVGTSNLPSKGVDFTERVVGRHQLLLDGSVDPLDPYFVRVGPSLSYTALLTTHLGLCAHATWVSFFETGTVKQLEQDFAVLPTVFAAVSWQTDLSFVWQPMLIRSATSEVYGTLGVGGGVGGFAAADQRTAALVPGLVASAQLTWVTALPKNFGVGASVGVREGAFFRGSSVVQLTTFNVGALMTFGAGPR